MDSDDFVPLSSPVASVMASIRSRAALKDHDTIRETARATDNPSLHKYAAKKLIAFDKHAEESQWWA
jgi:hypothetical protein